MFRPTVAAPGRLLRLGVVLDLRNRPDRLREIARMCDGAGIESLWTRDRTPAAPSELEPWMAMTLAAEATHHPTVGVTVSVGRRTPEILAAMATTLDAASAGRLELAFAELEGDARAATQGRVGLERYVAAIRAMLERGAVAMTDSLAERGSPRMSIEVIDDAGIEIAARSADDAAIPPSLARDAPSFIHRIRFACERNGRDPKTMGIALEVPVSIGRTTAEAQARAESEILFESMGQPSEVGVFGTLEQCQERVIELAHAGVTDLRSILPNSPDVQDVIAQLTAMAVGTVDVLSPNAPRSKAPDPPESWGGRAMR